MPEVTADGGQRLTARDAGAVIGAVAGTGKVGSLARLPDRVALTEIVAAHARTQDAGDALNIPFAVGESALQPVALPARSVPNMLVMGRQLCGKTTTLATIGKAVMHRLDPGAAQLTIIDPKTSLIGMIDGPHVHDYAYTADDIDRVIADLVETLRDRLPPAGLTQQQLLHRAAWRGAHHFVFIDDEHELRPHGGIGRPAATAPLWGLIERSREIGLHVVAARLPGNWAGVSVMNPFLQRLTAARSPTLFMDNDPTNVKVFGRIAAQQLPAGRGLLVGTDGEIEGVLVGAPD